MAPQLAVADTGFPRRGDTNPREGAPLLFGISFAEKCMKIEQNGLRRGACPSLPLIPPLIRNLLF